MDASRAIDRYIGELARAGRTPRTRDTYYRTLAAFVDSLPGTDRQAQSITPDECRAYLDRYIDHAPSTTAHAISIMRSWFRYLRRAGEITTDPMVDIDRPRRLRAEYLDVVTVTADQIARMFDACEDWQEYCCLGMAVYTGARRTALANVRWQDIEWTDGTITVREKGRKTQVKPVPWEWLTKLRAAWELLEPEPRDWIIPSRHPGKVRRRPDGTRSSKLVYETVKRIAERAGVDCHVHALRAAYAVNFLDQHPDRIQALKDLMGHDDIGTTMVYLRRRNRARDMEAVRDLTWGQEPAERRHVDLARTSAAADAEFTPDLPAVLEANAAEAHTGFEPVLDQPALAEPVRSYLATFAARSRSKDSPAHLTPARGTVGKGVGQ